MKETLTFKKKDESNHGMPYRGVSTTRVGLVCTGPFFDPSFFFFPCLKNSQPDVVITILWVHVSHVTVTIPAAYVSRWLTIVRAQFLVS